MLREVQERRARQGENMRKHLVESMVWEFESIWPGRIVDCKIADKVTGAKILESEPRFL